MRKLLLVVASLTCVAPSYAVMGVTAGLKGGVAVNAELAGVEIPADEIDRMNLVGAQIRVSTLPFIDIVLAGEYVWKSRSLEIEGYPAEYKVRDFVISVSAVYPVKMRIISPYGGVGIANHNLGYDFSPSVLPESIVGLSVPGDESVLGYHLLVGVGIELPGFPVGISGEFRANFIKTEGKSSHYNTLTAGINFSFL